MNTFFFGYLSLKWRRFTRTLFPIIWLIYIIYYDGYLENEIQIFGYVWDSNASGLFFIWFFYITFLSLKNYPSLSKKINQ